MRIQGFAFASLRTIDTKRGKEEMQGENGSLGKLGGKTARLGGVSPPSRIGYPPDQHPLRILAGCCKLMCGDLCRSRDLPSPSSGD